MLDSLKHSVYAVMPTPFTPDGRIDLKSLDRLVDFYTAAKVDGITILGLMGEATKLEQHEATSVAARVLARAPVPVIVGVSAPGMAAMRTLASIVMDAGAAGVMIAPAPSLRADEQILAYYRNAATAIGDTVPFVIQDYPLVHTVVMSASVICTIVEEHPNCVMLKHEDWPGLEKISALRSFEQAGAMRHISILCGNGGLFLDFETERGANGAMTGYCFPEMLVRLVELSSSGQRDEAHDLFDAHLPLLRYEQQPGLGLAVRKYVMMRRGLLDHEDQRIPGSALSTRARSEIDYLLARLARVDAHAALA
jgi:4-hydroxy-tetrahydrodipicolinate synthase